MVTNKYEIVIGLEVHAQLKTKSKIFCSDKNEYGSIPNSNVSAISLAHPGTLPKLNKKILEYATRLGLACKSEISRELFFDRKNYFYPDLPKGYQITQDKTPICNGGSVLILDEKNNEKSVKLNRIHIEEDAGKSTHDQDPNNTFVDLNRAGVPLLEIVTEPDIRSAKEAHNFLYEIRKLVRYLDICDGNLEQGSLRCDANVSIRLKGDEKLGNRVEIKNLNSLKNVQRAINFEVKRHIQILENGEIVDKDTRSFDDINGTTFSLRSKEEAHDYRYFPEPDLPPVTISKEFIKKIQSQMPPLPHELQNRYKKDLGLSDYISITLTEDKEIAKYFEEVIKTTSNYKAAANWIMTNVKGFLNQHSISIKEFPLLPINLGNLIELIDCNKISNNLAASKLFPEMIKNPSSSPSELSHKFGWFESTSEGKIEIMVESILKKYPDKVKAYKNGKKNLIGLFMGEIMKLSNGTADPKIASKILKDQLEN